MWKMVFWNNCGESCSCWLIQQWSSRVEMVEDYWHQEGWLVPQVQPSMHAEQGRGGMDVSPSPSNCSGVKPGRQRRLITAGFVSFYRALDLDAFCLLQNSSQVGRIASGATSGHKQLLLCLSSGVSDPWDQASQQLPLHSTVSMINDSTENVTGEKVITGCQLWHQRVSRLTLRCCFNVAD